MAPLALVTSSGFQSPMSNEFDTMCAGRQRQQAVAQAQVQAWQQVQHDDAGVREVVFEDVGALEPGAPGHARFLCAAAGVLDQPLNHAEVMEMGNKVKGTFRKLLDAMIAKM